MSDDDIGAVGADDIFIDTGAEDDVGAATAKKARSGKGRPAYRRVAFLPGVAIAAGATSVLPVVLNAPFKGVGLRMQGPASSMDAMLYNGSAIRGRPQEGSAGAVGCAIFRSGETFMWEWDTANPGEQFTVSFTNTAAASLAPLGYLIGYLAP